MTLPLEEIRSLIEQARDAWIGGNADQFASLFTPNGELIVPGNRWVGMEAIHQALTDFAATASHVSIEIHRIIVDGNQAVVEWHWQDTTLSGQTTRADDAIVVDFQGNKISRWREYIDTQTWEEE
ncbi:MAG: SgcJ/EcaC family oxidoreductase [Leptolyngbyaceae cyanobacterium SL_7_1]|nr:SgcJ/EcaC family oxidoreductase [Leptolyngbyaceae cyanobacterium SL_7_1]